MIVKLRADATAPCAALANEPAYNILALNFEILVDLNCRHRHAQTKTPIPAPHDELLLLAPASYRSCKRETFKSSIAEVSPTGRSGRFELDSVGNLSAA